MRYIAGFAPAEMQPQTYPASPEAVAVDRYSAQALAVSKLGSPGQSRASNELTSLANAYGMLQTPHGLATYERAMKFLVALPPSVQLPELSVDPDGEISFDWTSGSDALSISLNAAGGIAYAANIRRQRTSGPAFFGGGALPREITDAIGYFR